MNKHVILGVAVLLAALVTGLIAQEEEQDEGTAEAPAVQPTESDVQEEDAPPAEEEGGTMTEMLERLRPTPLEEEEARPGEPTREPAERIRQPILDPRVIGVAPDMPQPKLRREGEFVIRRQGKLVRSVEGAAPLFIFDSGGKGEADPPMILVPSQTLESMEDLIVRRGEDLTFEISGQVLKYRGANYLLPTMMKPVLDKGNLQ